jgi:hypothetical protein
MSDALAPQSATEAGGASPFNGRVMLFVIGAAILSFVGYLFLSAYAPEMKSGSDGRGHAYSNAAIGYSGIVKLREALGRSPNVVRDTKGLETDRLVVATPEFGTDPDALAKLVTDRDTRPTLIVLPKRTARPNPLKKGWVVGREIAPASDVAGLVSKVAGVTVKQHRAEVPETYYSEWAPDVRFAKGAVVQTIEGEQIESYISDDEGRILLGGLRRATTEGSKEEGDDDYTPVYILSDPDVLNNLGLGDPHMAYAASGILDGLSTDKTKEVEFDVTLNGFAATRGLLKLAFEPPFLALSICLFVAALMALANGLMRFGPPLREGRAVAPGKGALVSNTADLLRLAGHEADIGGRYAALSRDAAAHALGLPPGMSADVVTQRLDRVTRAGPPFSALAASADNASTTDDMLAAARALYHWRKEKTG